MLRFLLTFLFTPCFFQLSHSAEDRNAKGPLTEIQKESLEFLVSTVADNGLLKILNKEESLKKKARNVRDVHLLKLIEVVFTDPTIKTKAHKVYKDHFKWSIIKGSAAKRLAKKSKSADLEPHIASFCNTFNLDPQKIEQYQKQEEWSSLLEQIAKKSGTS